MENSYDSISNECATYNDSTFLRILNLIYVTLVIQNLCRVKK